MKRLIVTEESLERAKRIFSANGANSPYSTCVAFEMALDALFVPDHQKSTSFGPGTRLRTANGDTLLVVKYYNYKDWGIVNLTTNTFGDPKYAEGWWSPDNLQKQLISAGATVIMEDD